MGRAAFELDGPPIIAPHNDAEAVALAEKGLREAQLELDIASLRVQEAAMLLKLVERFGGETGNAGGVAFGGCF